MKHVKMSFQQANIFTENNYKYNAKEFQDEFNINLYDYGARNYDPAIGRWFNIDPLAELYPDFSPYVYAANVPTKFVDYDGRDFGVSIDHDKKTITIIGHVYANKKDIALLNEIATYLNEQTGVVLKVGEGESATDYSIGFNITTEENETPNKSANKANRSDNDPLGKMNNSFTQNSDDSLVRGKSVRGSASRTKSAIKNDEGVFAGAHEILHLLDSGHKNGIMSDGATSGGVTEDIYGAILKGVGNGSIGSGNKNAIGQGHIRSESGDRPNGFMKGSIMNKAQFDRQMQRAVEKRIKQNNKK